MDFLIVNLNKTAPNQVCLGIVTLGDGDYLTECPRNDASALFSRGAHHSMGLATASLPVGENGAIIPIKYIVDKREGTLLIN